MAPRRLGRLVALLIAFAALGSCGQTDPTVDTGGPGTTTTGGDSAGPGTATTGGAPVEPGTATTMCSNPLPRT